MRLARIFRTEQVARADFDDPRTLGFLHQATAFDFYLQHQRGDVTGQYEVLSRNEMTDFIAFPDAVVSGNVRLERHTSKVASLMTAYVDIREDGVVDVRVTRIPATHRIETLGRNESPAGATVTVGFRPDADKVVFEKVSFRVNEDGTMTEIKPKVVVAQTEIPEDPDNYQVGSGEAAGVITPETLANPQ